MTTVKSGSIVRAVATMEVEEHTVENEPLSPHIRPTKSPYQLHHYDVRTDMCLRRAGRNLHSVAWGSIDSD